MSRIETTCQRKGREGGRGGRKTHISPSYIYLSLLSHTHDDFLPQDTSRNYRYVLSIVINDGNVSNVSLYHRLGGEKMQ
jgi:hypothetical protein